MNAYATTLEAVESLPSDEQESLLQVMQRRLAELIATVKQARKELAAGRVKPASVVAIMRRIKS